jgi:hypothetical protein
MRTKPPDRPKGPDRFDADRNKVVRFIDARTREIRREAVERVKKAGIFRLWADPKRVKDHEN